MVSYSCMAYSHAVYVYTNMLLNEGMLWDIHMSLGEFIMEAPYSALAQT